MSTKFLRISGWTFGHGLGWGGGSRKTPSRRGRRPAQRAAPGRQQRRSLLIPDSLHGRERTRKHQPRVKVLLAPARDQKVTHRLASSYGFHHPTRRCLDRFGSEFPNFSFCPGAHREPATPSPSASRLIPEQIHPLRPRISLVTDPTKKSRSGGRGPPRCLARAPTPAIRTRSESPAVRRQGRPGCAVSHALACSSTVALPAPPGPVSDPGPRRRSKRTIR